MRPRLCCASVSARSMHHANGAWSGPRRSHVSRRSRRVACVPALGAYPSRCRGSRQQHDGHDGGQPTTAPRTMKVSFRRDGVTASRATAVANIVGHLAEDDLDARRRCRRCAGRRSPAARRQRRRRCRRSGCVGSSSSVDDHHVVRRLVAVRRQQRRVGDDDGPDVAASGHHVPSHVERPAPRAHRPRRHAPPTARRRTPARAARRPRSRPRTAQPLRRRRREGSGPRSPAVLRSSSALVGTPSPLVTSETSAPSTCEQDSPLIWRAPSTIRLKPWTYASDMPPPLVFVGRPSAELEVAVRRRSRALRRACRSRSPRATAARAG